MSLFSVNALQAKSQEETELLALTQILMNLNVSVAKIVAFAKTNHTPEIGLQQSIKDSLFLLDSNRNNSSDDYIGTSSSFRGRKVTGKLQRIEALKTEFDDLFAALESYTNE